MTTRSDPRGPRGHRLLGNLPDLLHDPTGFLERCAGEFGGLVPLRFGPRRALLVNDPDLIGEVLVDRRGTFTKPYILRTDQLRVGDHRLGETGDGARRHHVAQPAFHRHRLPEYGDSMLACTQQLLQSWGDGETRDFQREMMRLTLQIAADTLFGTDLTSEAEAIGDALQTVMDGFRSRLGTLFLMPEWLPTASNRRVHGALRRLDTTIERVIVHGQARQEHRDDLLAFLLAAVEDGRLSPREVRDQAMTFFLAGHETTALALSWTWYLLATHPTVETRLAAELDSVLGGRLPTPDDAPHLRYVAQVVHEALRLYPPIWVLARVARQDDQLGDRPVRAGTILLISPWVMHRDARYFAEPECFNPDRWTAGLAQRLPRYAYFPFGGGPRGCIGSQFAQLEAVLVVAAIAQQFRLTLAPGHRVVAQPSITLRAEHWVPVLLHRRPLVTASLAHARMAETSAFAPGSG